MGSVGPVAAAVGKLPVGVERIVELVLAVAERAQLRDLNQIP